MRQLNPLGYCLSHNNDLNWHMGGYHLHDYYEINFVLTDNVDFFVAERLYCARAGALFVFNDLDLHRSVSDPHVPHERYVLYFDPQSVVGWSTDQTNLLGCFVNRRPGFSHCVQLAKEESQTLLSLLRRLERYGASSDYGADVYPRIALIEILIYVNKLFRSSQSSSPQRVEKKLERVLPIIKYIQQNLASDLSLDHLSRTFFLNKYYLGQLFKEVTGFTVAEYIIHRRILRARELLKTDVTVQQVGALVGYNNTSHFIRTFKKLVGISPKQYQLNKLPGRRTEGHQ